MEGTIMDESEEFERIREGLRIAIESSTLRFVASQVRMSPTGLTKFVAGSHRPYGKTKEKVRAWFYSHAAMNALAPDDALRFLRRFVLTLSEPDRAVTRLLDSVESLYREEGMFAPDWVRRVRRRIDPRIDPPSSAGGDLSAEP
jgi:hypothetical protein